MGGAGNPFQLLNPFNTGTDPTAKLAGQTPSAKVYDGTIQENLVMTPLGPMPSVLPIQKVTTRQANAETQGANQVLDRFENDNQELAGLFGQKEITDFNVYVEPEQNLLDPKTGKSIPLGPEASHPAPQAGEPAHYEDNLTLRLDPNNPQEAMGLTDAEVIESYEDRTQSWKAGLASGEALSRALSFQMQPTLARDPRFSADPMQKWWSSGHQDYINGNPDFGKTVTVADPATRQKFQVPVDPKGTKEQASDGNQNSNGAGTLFLDYLHDKLGYSWNQIIGAKGDTLGEKYQSLSGKSGQQGFLNFVNALPTEPGNPGKLDLPSDGSSPFTAKNEANHAINEAGHQIEQGASRAWNWLKGLF